MRDRKSVTVGMVALLALGGAGAIAGAVGCSGAPTGQGEVATTPATAPAESIPAELGPPPKDAGPLPTLLVVQAQFTTGDDGKPKPGAAKLELLQTDGKTWYQQVIEDAESNVFHKAIPWRGGILTIGGEKARLVHWTKQGDAWTPNVLWQREWGGKFNRFRDVEIGDVDQDGKDEIVLATHDQGVVAVGEEGPTSWAFHELDQTPDTFVHEIEIGDIDGDKKLEFYATPSGRNRADGSTQDGSVVRYDVENGNFVRQVIVHWPDSHAKEILVTDMDGDGKDELYVAHEAQTHKADGKVVQDTPTQIERWDKVEKDQWAMKVVASWPNETQLRFLVAGDVDGDGKKDMVAATMKSGIFLLKPNADGTFAQTPVDANATGFENSTKLADLDGDKKDEIYVAADDQREIRRYVWNGSGFDRTVIAKIPPSTITWNIEQGDF